ncbi:MAG: hypothetical protein WC023_01595 [Rhodocyclaceae bacterium]
MTKAVDFLHVLKTYLPGNNWKVSHQQGNGHMLVANDSAVGYSALRIYFTEDAKTAILKCYEVADKKIPHCLEEFAIDFLPTEDLFFAQRAEAAAVLASQEAHRKQVSEIVSRKTERRLRRAKRMDERRFWQQSRRLTKGDGGSGVIAGKIVIRSAWPVGLGDSGAESLDFCGRVEPSLCEDEPSTIDRVAHAFERAHRTWSPFGPFLGDEFDYQFTDTRNGVAFFGHDRSGHSGRVECCD